MAHSTFQSSPILPTATVDLAVPTVPPPTATAPVGPPQGPPATPEPIELTPELPPTDAARPITPTASGYLPPPTLTNPDALIPGRPSSLQPTGQPPLVGPAAPPVEATSTPATSDVPSSAQLIDNGVVALSYVWLCCGGLALAGAALGLVWLARRSKRR
jgi:hypothetical protein